MNFLRFGQQGGQTDKTNHAIFSVQQKLTRYAVISAITNKPLACGSLSPAQSTGAEIIDAYADQPPSRVAVYQDTIFRRTCQGGKSVV